MNQIVVGLYARVSTKDKEQNPENQLIRLREYCKARGWNFREYVDFASGAKKDRPALLKLFSDVESIDGVLTLRIDRFGRSAMQLASNIFKLKESGKFFEAIDQGIKVIPGEKDPQTQFLHDWTAVVMGCTNPSFLFLCSSWSTCHLSITSGCVTAIPTCCDVCLYKHVSSIKLSNSNWVQYK